MRATRKVRHRSGSVVAEDGTAARMVAVSFATCVLVAVVAVRAIITAVGNDDDEPVVVALVVIVDDIGGAILISLAMNGL